MSRTPKLQLKLNPLLLRYLEDIEAKQDDRNKNKTVVPYEMFLIDTFFKEELNNDAFSERNKTMFEDFKQYFVKEKILEFPSLHEFGEKYEARPKWNREFLTKEWEIDRNHTEEYLIYFPVKVKNFQKLQDFIKTFKKTSDKKNFEVEGLTEFDRASKTLTKRGLKEHNFQTTKNVDNTLTLKVFKRLWDLRYHTHKDSKQIINGENEEERGESFDNFRAQLFMIETRQIFSDKERREQDSRKVRNIIQNFVDDGFPFKVSIKNKIILRVED